MKKISYSIIIKVIVNRRLGGNEYEYEYKSGFTGCNSRNDSRAGGIRKAEKRRFVIAVVIAILGTLTAFSESGDGNASLVGMMIGTPMAFLLFGGIPYGWNLVSKVTRYFEWILFLPIMGWLIYFGVKLMASMCCGWFFFGRECLVRIKAKGGRG